MRLFFFFSKYFFRSIKKRCIYWLEGGEILIRHALYWCVHLSPCPISGIDSDIIDEAIYYFKANVFFKNYEIKVRNVHAVSVFFFFYVWMMGKHVPHCCACSSQCFPFSISLTRCALKQLLTLFLHMSQLASSPSPQLCIVAQDFYSTTFYWLYPTRTELNTVMLMLWTKCTSFQ